MVYIHSQLFFRVVLLLYFSTWMNGIFRVEYLIQDLETIWQTSWFIVITSEI